MTTDAFSDEQIARVREEHAAGVTIAELAERHGVAEKLIAQWTGPEPQAEPSKGGGAPGRRNVNRELHRMTVALDSVADSVLITDADGVVDYINPTAAHLIGIARDDAVGQSLDDLLFLERLPGSFQASDLPDLMRYTQEEAPPADTTWSAGLRSRAGSTHTVELAATRLRMEDGDGPHDGSDGLVVHIRDVTASAKLAAKLTHQATHDPLTGLYNRREFERRLSTVCEAVEISSDRHALCYMDLDQFKVVNDTCGHAAGDELLKQVAETLDARLRAADMIARLGGDEFGLILANCGVEDARRITENIRRTIEEFRFNWDGNTFKIGISIGVVPIQRGAGGIDQLLRRADAACYIAKETGRNRVHIHEEDDVAVARRRGAMRWVTEIQSAMDEDRFLLSFQRIESLKEDEQTGWAEMLVRVRTSDGEAHTPGAFLPAAERYGMAHVVDQWITSRCIRWLYEGSAAREGVTRCSINLSGVTLSKESFLDYVEELLERYPIAPESLCFEVTETAAISNLRAARKFFEVFKARGCSFALDDFGSGVSSFSYLRDLPVDYLKIDGTFVRDVDTDRLNREFVRSIHAIGKIMGLKTIAEFVETPRVLTVLRELGVDYGQGYFMHEPTHATMTAEPRPRPRGRG